MGCSQQLREPELPCDVILHENPNPNHKEVGQKS